jgi:sugar fermentation stimulation protein A
MELGVFRPRVSVARESGMPLARSLITSSPMSSWVRLHAPSVLAPGRRPIHARFVDRPSRFSARVTLDDGTVAWGHLANPGRLTGVLSPECDLLLDGPFPPPRMMAYSVLAARVGRIWVGTVTTYANRVFPSLLDAGLFPELDRAPIATEVVCGRSRFDFNVAGTFVEVKSVSLADGRAGLFPDAVTARGARHCDALAGIATRGTHAAIVFVAQRRDVESVAPADAVDAEFGRALRRAAQAGVRIMAVTLSMGQRGARAARRVPVIIGT